MQVDSFYFLFFAAAVYLVYWNITKKYQWVVLLAASLGFYFMNAVWYTFIYVIVSTYSVYLAARYFHSDRKNKKLVLLVTLVLNIAILAFLKYMPLGVSTLNVLTGTNYSPPDIVPSLAVSFYMLQLTAYLLDVYWNVCEAENNPVKLLLYVIYFPLMTSGPIHRANELKEQFFKPHDFSYQQTADGLKRTAFGFLKKIAAAGQLKLVADAVYNEYSKWQGISIWLAAVIFVLQLYMDFSGCMDIVIGISKCFGITLQENFNAPFFSLSMQEFWQRWHITLGRWLRDYIMNPLLKSKTFIKLGADCREKFGKKGRKIPVFIAMYAVWTLMGVWHGSSWKYIIGEGWFMWAILVLEQISAEYSRKTGRIKNNRRLFTLFQRIRTLLLFSFGMIFFRAQTLSDSFAIISRAFQLSAVISDLNSFWGLVQGTLGIKNLVICLACIAAAGLADWLKYHEIDVISVWNKKSAVIHYAAYWLWLILIIMYMGTSEGFIYQQF